MDHADSVSLREGTGHAATDAPEHCDTLGLRRRLILPGRKNLAEGPSFEVRHHDHRDAVVGRALKDGTNVGVIESGRSFNLRRTDDDFRANGRAQGVKNFDRNLPIQAIVDSFEDGALSSATEASNQSVAAHLISRGQGAKLKGAETFLVQGFEKGRWRVGLFAQDLCQRLEDGRALSA